MGVQPVAGNNHNNARNIQFRLPSAAEASHFVSKAGWGEVSNAIDGAALATKLNHGSATFSQGAAKALMVGGKYLPVINGIVGIYNTRQAYKLDNALGDPYHTQATKTGFGATVSFGLGLAASTALIGLSAPILPAVALGVGAAYAGQAIGEEIGGAFVAARQWWNS